MEEVFDVKEVADYLHCSQSTIRKLLKNNQIPSFGVAYRVFFKKCLIDLWINNQCFRSCEVMKNE
jgi:excisionase family DNA binding protein